MSTQFATAAPGSSAVEGDGSNGAIGITGTSDSGYGVFGGSTSGSAGVYGTSGKNGVFGETSSANDSGVLGQNDGTGTGVTGSSQSGTGVVGKSLGGSGIGLSGSSQGGHGVYAISSTSSAAFFENTNVNNMLPVLVASTTGGNTGLDSSSQGGIGIAGHSQSNIGVAGNSQSNTGVSGTGNIGIEGFSTNSTGTGILGHSPLGGAGFAGKFLGNVDVQGTINKSALTFKIDHPLDPAQKYLSHAGVEAAEMKNIYDGVVILDAEGEAVVELPAWFEVLNTEFRYQLTCIGAYAPVYIAQEVKGNRFKLAGGKPGMKVSWQITGKRRDPYALAHPLVVEEEKPEGERGYYRHPELYHEPEERGIAWVAYPEQMQRLKQAREK